MKYCELTETPEFQYTVDNIRDTFGTDAERIAYKNYLENEGVFSTPQEIIDREKQEFFSPVVDKEVMKVWETIDYLQRNGLISMKRVDWSADVIYRQVGETKALNPNFENYKISDNDVILSVPRIYTEKSAATNIRNNKSAFAGDKDIQAYEALQQYLDENDIDYIRTLEFKNSYIVVMNKDVYYNALSERRRSQKEVTRFYRETSPNTALILDLNQYDPYYFSKWSNDRTVGYGIVKEYAKELSGQLGVDYDFISSDEAYNLTKDLPIKWAGEKAFFIGGKVYFVGDYFNKESILHEFSHPLIRSIFKDNNPLFNELYDQLASTKEGKDIIEEVNKYYPEKEYSEDILKEEALVRALTKAYKNSEDKVTETAPFRSFVDNLLYHFKRLLRKVFGPKIPVSSLDVNTTLEQLADMLKKGDKFQISDSVLENEDIIAFERNYEDQMKALSESNLDAKEVEDLTNQYFNLVSKQLKQLMTDNKYPELLEVVKNKYKTGELEKMKQNLKPYQTLIQQDSKKMLDEVQLTHERAISVINSLNSLGNMVSKIYENLQEVVKDIDDPANVQKAMYYQKSLNYWNEFITTAVTALERDDVKIPIINRITSTIRRSNDLVNQFYQKATADVLWNELKGSAEKIDQKWKDRIKSLETKGAPQSVIDAEKKKYELEKITPETIRKALNGELKDLNFANAYMEGYSFSTDPVVGGLAAYVKNAHNDVETRAQRKVNTQSDELSGLLKANNYNPNKVGQLGIDLGQKEKVGKPNHETGEFEEKEVWRFLNQFTGADLARDKFWFDIKVASQKYNETKSEEDAQKLADVQAAWEQHTRDFFHQEYTEPFYQMYDLLKKDDIGKKAKVKMDDLYGQINQLQNSVSTSEDEIKISDQLESLRRQIKQMSSLTDVFGNKKTGEDFQIAERIQQFNEKSREIYYSEEIPGAFQDALANFEQKLIDEGKGRGSEAFANARAQWLEKNTRIVIEDSFWETLNDVNERIKAILDTLPNDVSNKLEIENAYKEIKDILTGNKDESGQPVGGEMNDESLAKIKAAQERIQKAQQFLNKTNGLTKAEQVQLEDIFARIDAAMAGGKRISDADNMKLQHLLDKQEIIGLDKVKRAALRGLYAKLEELRRREPTDSYVDTVNAYLNGIEENPLYEKIKANQITKDNAYVILNDDILELLFEKSEAFEKWFKNNHYRKPTIDQSTGQEVEKWEKTYAWNVMRPNDEQYLKKTYIKDESGNVVETIVGLPAMKYFKRLVKEQYTTKKIVGVTVDNTDRWLPKTPEQGAKDDRYINKAYFELKRRDPKKFQLLEKMKEIHLRNQEGAHKKSKLYLDMPRYEKGGVESLLVTKENNPVQRLVYEVKSFWTKVKDGWDSGFNFDDEFQLTKMDLLDDETTGIPISGLSNIPIEQTSTDIAYTMMRYMLSVERQNKLIEISPVARAVQQVVNNKANFPFAQKTTNDRTILNLGKKKDKYVRAQAVNNFIEKTFEGKVNAGWGAENVAAQKFSNALFKQASFSFLALNIPSAIKNAIGAKFQGLIESVAGKYMTTQDFLSSEVWATNTTFKISGEIYKQGSKSMDVQLVELFDPERDRFKYSIGESLTRTPFKDTLMPLERLNDFRKWTQLQATLQIFGGMMKHQKVSQNGKDIPYIDAWEVKDGKIQLKDGIDPIWGITYDKEGNQVIGEKFKTKKNEIQRVIDNLNGAMGREDRPEADRYLLFRYLSFFRRWMVSMFTNRFAYSGDLLKGTSRGRYDFQLGDTKEGYYITNMKTMAKLFKSMGKYLPYASADEKAAFMRLGTEVGTLILMSTLLPAMFGWDSDDEDRYKKLRAKSGALPFLFVDDDPTRPFDLGGWMSNHALLMIMQTRGENDQFLPAPGMGLNDYKQFLDIKSMVFGPTLKTYFDIAQDLGYIVSGDDKAYYQRDIGAYEWQKQDELKIWNHIGKAFGMTGSSLDPATTIRAYQNIQNQ